MMIMPEFTIKDKRSRFLLPKIFLHSKYLTPKPPSTPARLPSQKLRKAATILIAKKPEVIQEEKPTKAVFENINFDSSNPEPLHADKSCGPCSPITFDHSPETKTMKFNFEVFSSPPPSKLTIHSAISRFRSRKTKVFSVRTIMSPIYSPKQEFKVLLAGQSLKFRKQKVLIN